MAHLIDRDIFRRLLVLVVLADLFLLAPVRGYSQEIIPEFLMHLDQLPLQQQEDLRYFNRNLTDYVGSVLWINERLPEPVRLHMEAFLTYRGSVVKTQYAAKLTVSNGLDIKYLDRYWRFEYEPDDMLRHDDRDFHSITWFIDYYVHLMIGHDLDKYREYGGNEHFQKAEALCMTARFDPDYQRGWDERLELAQTVLSEDYKPYRSARALFYSAMRQEKARNNTEARTLARQAIGILAKKHALNAKDEWLTNFFNAHYLKLADVFKTETSPDVYEQLMRIDPEHRKTYDEYIANLGK